MRKKLEDKLRSHNEKNGEIIKKLREENGKLAQLLSDATAALPSEAVSIVETPNEASIDDTPH
jgi:flagellar biosynthesis/type III secretory pathway chaperone